MRYSKGLVLGLFLLTLTSAACAASSGQISKGKTIAKQVCAACHGLSGISTASNIPNLAGQKQAYLEARVNGFRRQTIKGVTMGGMASSLSPNDVANVTAYYSSLRNCQK
ncbi:MAG TPA: cytochrome c [Gammaproteobacteria bacterium]|nr:cytochrome c [Gammaproteobacteria bacterium]